MRRSTCGRKAPGRPPVSSSRTVNRSRPPETSGTSDARIGKRRKAAVAVPVTPIASGRIVTAGSRNGGASGPASDARTLSVSTLSVRTSEASAPRFDAAQVRTAARRSSSEPVENDRPRVSPAQAAGTLRSAVAAALALGAAGADRIGEAESDGDGAGADGVGRATIATTTSALKSASPPATASRRWTTCLGRGRDEIALRGGDESTDAGAEVVLADVQRRDEANDLVVRARRDEQDVPLERAGDRPLRGRLVVELDGDHRAERADLADARGTPQRRELLDHDLADVVRARDEPFVAQDVERRETGGAGHRVAAEGRAVRPGPPAVMELTGSDDRAERQAAAERLREHEDVRAHTDALRGGPGARPAKTRLHLVEDEERADAVRERAQAPQERRGRSDVAAFAERGLDEERRDVLRRQLVLEDRLDLRE